MSGTPVFWLAAAVAVLLFWSLGAYNRLVGLRAQGISRFAAVDQRMAQALGLLAEAAAGDDAGATPVADRAGRHAGSPAARAGLQAAAVQFEVALRVARRQPLDAGVMAALQAAHSTVHAVWERCSASASAPDTTTMQRGWQDSSRDVHEAQAGYNAAVQDYNAAIAQFPASVLAYFFGFGPAGSL